MIPPLSYSRIGNPNCSSVIMTKTAVNTDNSFRLALAPGHFKEKAI